MRILETKDNEYTKLKDFVTTKAQKRVMRDLEEKEQIRRMEKRQKMEEELTKYKEIINNIQVN